MRIFLLLIFFSPLLLYSQGPGRSKYERLWALSHPFAAIKVKLISKKCYRIYNRNLQHLTGTEGRNEKYLDVFSNGGKLDAFRHVFFMAAFAQKVKIKKLRKLGEAHEKANYKMFLRCTKEFGELPDSLGSVMDLSNNELAFKIVPEIKKLSLPELEEFVIKQINAGSAIIMKRKKNGSYLDCNDKVIDLKLYKDEWNVPKCLVLSNYVYVD
jgi:hypothetical protein